MGCQRTRTIVVVGNKAAGKTSIVHRLIDEPIDFSTYTPTIDECYNITWKMAGGQFLQIEIIDTAPWNEFPAMQTLFVKRAHLILVVYDVTSPSWRESLQSIVEEVRAIQENADIVIIGNKCDKLKKEDGFTPKRLTPSTHCVGQIYTSALSQQGIVGLKQLILCSKSKLTEGHYTEFGQVPKRKKLKKKTNGLAISLHLWRRKEKASSEPIASSDDTLNYSDYINSNFDKLFDNVPGSRLPETTAHTLPIHRTRVQPDPHVRYTKSSSCNPGSKVYRANLSMSDLYSSLDSNDSLEVKGCGRRKSLDFSKLEPIDGSSHRRKLCRKESASCGHEVNLGSPTSSNYDSDFSSMELIGTSPTLSAYHPPGGASYSPKGYRERTNYGRSECRWKDGGGVLSAESSDSEGDGKSSHLYRYSKSHDMLHSNTDEITGESGTLPQRPLQVNTKPLRHKTGLGYIKQLAKQHSSADDITGGKRKLVRQ